VFDQAREPPRPRLPQRQSTTLAIEIEPRIGEVDKAKVSGVAVAEISLTRQQ
jgi:hypothetical protein